MKTAIGAVFLTALLVSSSLAQTISYGEAMDQLIASCGDDVDTYCKDVRLGGSRIQDCLHANSSKVSPACKSTFGRVSELLEIRARAQVHGRGAYGREGIA